MRRLILRSIMWLVIVWFLLLLFAAGVGLAAEKNSKSIFRSCNTISVKWDFRVNYTGCKE